MEAFLEPTLTSVCKILDQRNSTGDYAEDSDLLQELVQQAFVQVKAFCRRNFSKGTYEELLQAKPTGIERTIKDGPYIRLSLVEPLVASVEVSVADTPVLTTIISPRRSIIQIEADSLYDALRKNSTSFFSVVYDAGYDTATQLPPLDGAITLQAMALFHQRDNLGLSDFSFDNGPTSFSLKVNGGELIPAARAMAQPLKYMGATCAQKIS